MRVLKHVGLIVAADAALTAAVVGIARVLMGILGGLPIHALAVNSMVASMLTCALELPTGIFADVIGPSRTLKMGYALQGFAQISLFASIAVFAHSEQLMWIFLVGEAVFDAFGNALISGAKEAVLQNAIDQQAQSMPLHQQEHFRESSLAASEKNFRWLPFASPLVGLALCLWLQTEHKAGHFLLLALAIGWFALVLTVHKFSGVYKLEPQSVAPLKARVRQWVLGVRSIAKDGLEAQLATLVGVVGLFLYAVTESYFVVTFSKSSPSFGVGYGLLILVGAVSVGKLLQSYVVPIVMGSLSAWTSAWVGAAGLFTVSLIFSWALALFGPHLNVWVSLVFLILYAPFVNLIFKAALGRVLALSPPEVRATAVSVRSALMFLGLSAFSSYFSMMGSLPSSTFLLHLLLLGSVAVMALLMVNHLRRAKVV